jgi:cytochrome oxidase assembly protein ShyY1
VVPLIQGVLDGRLTLITRGWMPWSGKRFDASNHRGDNRLATDVLVRPKS